MQRLIFSDKFTAELSSVTNIRGKLKKSLIASKIEDSLVSKILLAFSEASTNVILHNTAKKPILINLSQHKQEYQLTLIDDGFPWDPTAYCIPTSDEVSIYSENGRGIILLNSVSNSVIYTEPIGSYTNHLTLIWEKPSTACLPSILIVDDDESTSRLYSAYLENDFDVNLTSSGSDAIEWLEQNKVDLIVSDIRMPNMDGISLRKFVNQNSKIELVPFIFISAVTDKEIIDSACNLGIDDLLHKPISKSKLLQTINRVLSRTEQIEYLASSKIQRKISKLLRPTVPSSFENWKMSLRYRNTGLGGGDILLTHQTEDNIYITVIDIMGHDEIAKFFSYAYAGYIRGLMKSYNPPLAPSKLLEKLSKIAFDDDLLSHVTLTCCAVALSKNGKATIASAGHPSPILISNKFAKNVNIGGILPGLIPDASYQEISIDLYHNQRLAIFTDGLFESANTPDTRLNLEDKIIESLISVFHEEIETAVSTVISTFDNIAGNPPNDDTLLLLIGK